MKAAIYGGTFDPFHKVHRRVVKSVLKSGYVDKLYVIPAGTPPHKGKRSISFSAYRYRMAELALAKFSQVELSDYEIKEPGTSYTIKTVRYFQENLLDEEDELYLVMGSDSLMEIENWKEFLSLLRQCTLLVAARPGETEAELAAQKHRLEKLYQAKILFFEMKESDVSSTAVRKGILEGKLDEQEVPQLVKEFIRQNGLYAEDPLENFSEEQILTLRDFERQLLALMSVNRLVHSLNVMYEAVRIARRFGIDPWKAAVAGLLHDAAKEQDYHEFPEVLSRLDEAMLNNKPIIHGPIGAALVMEQFGITDPAIIDAIYHHSSLTPVPSPLEKVVYLADKIEPGRIFADLKPIREMALKDLDRAVLMTIDGSWASIRAHGGKMHRDTLAARVFLQRQIEERTRLQSIGPEKVT
ncbi:MAG: nicotinate (nicotinamide) nucleotide adenylyltransferase [Clostridia bacterium]|nr:nicotinate (nicotinamide) nucleotide adenylyltransferase [Clostridia bacterium]NLF20619.1 nicotinate (nicotinamide) nucleotide adenylyltransferase [Clostridiaceae bacterium]